MGLAARRSYFGKLYALRRLNYLLEVIEFAFVVDFERRVLSITVTNSNNSKGNHSFEDLNINANLKHAFIKVPIPCQTDCRPAFYIFFHASNFQNNIAY